MKILIFGASGTGTTTLGRAIANQTDFIHLDADDYYWEKTDPPFQEKIPLEKRNQSLKKGFNNKQNAIISGSILTWGKSWQTMFDLAFFIRLDNEIRMQRLRKREMERYGTKLETDETVQRNSEAFLKWAAQYENPEFKGRSLKLHTAWMELLPCKVVQLDGNHNLEDLSDDVIVEIENWYSVN